MCSVEITDPNVRLREGHDLHAPLTPTDHRRGAPRPTITVVEYSDFASEACRAAEPAVKMLLAAHPLALMAAEATEAAAAHGKFWEMHDLLLREGASLHRKALDMAAEVLGLDIARFRASLDDETYRQRIRAQQDGVS